MGLYQYLSGFLTIAGYVLLTYRSIFQLSSDRGRSSDLLQSLTIKWIILILFIRFEPTIESIMEIIPFGSLAVLVIKCILILPENTLAMMVYRKLERRLEKIQFEEYSSRLTVYLSSIIKFFTIKIVNLSTKLVVLINSQEIEQVEQAILDLIKAIEYKKAAVMARQEVIRSDYRAEFQRADSLNESTDSIDQGAAQNFDKPLESPRVGFRKSEISERMSKVLADLGEEKDYKIKAKEMIIKPNKQTGQKAVYDEVNIEFEPKTRQIFFINKHGVTDKNKLLEIRYVTKDMMILQLVLQKAPTSKVVKLNREEDVVNWMKPIVEMLAK